MKHTEGQKKISQVAEIELVYLSKVRAKDRPKVSDSKDAYHLFLQNWDIGRIGLVEEFKVMFLSRAARVLGIFELSRGGITGTVVDPRLIFAAALKAAACSIIMAHNHPSENLTPSKNDEDITQKLRGGGDLLEIKVLDHLIICPDGYYSFADQGGL